ncbi:Arc family DNA-binding protein [Ectopseudomonas khazarica]|uniref:Arc family DNA-binding protein n=1 Tax=Ectopseudomonas khazarica TaxID=2502979 RepID=UPI00384CA9AA
MDEIYRSQFRLPYPLYEQLKASADANHRSVNAELVARLEESLVSDSFDDSEYFTSLPGSTTRYPTDRGAGALERDLRDVRQQLHALTKLVRDRLPSVDHPEHPDFEPSTKK